jgi:hypothetical protein
VIITSTPLSKKFSAETDIPKIDSWRPFPATTTLSSTTSSVDLDVDAKLSRHTAHAVDGDALETTQRLKSKTARGGMALLRDFRLTIWDRSCDFVEIFFTQNYSDTFIK